MLVPVYDIKNCGPRHRFVANGKLVHNSDGINLQNLPARGGTELKACIEAPPGYVMIDCDSSNIEARVLAWLAEQNDLVTDFANKVDVYCKMATKIYGREITKADKSERFVGKTVTLGCGYQTGAVKLQATLKTATPPMDLEATECERIIDIYRSTYPRIKQLWYQGDQCIEAMHANKVRWFGKQGVVQIEGRKGVRLPSGLYVSYPQLHRAAQQNTNRMQWQYKDDTGLVGIYGGKFTENCLAAGTQVLTNRGWVVIEEVRLDDLVHDGVEFVKHGGVIFKSVQACVSIDGVLMTPDHEVLTNDGWIPASQNPEPYRPDLRYVDGVKPRTQRREEAELAFPMPVRGTMRQSRGRRDQRGEARGDTQLRMRNKTTYGASAYDARDEQASSVCSVAQYVRSLPTAFAQGMGKLRRARDRCLRALAVFREFLVRHGSDVRSWTRARSHRQRRALQPGELPLGGSSEKCHEQTNYYSGGRCTQTIRRNWDLPQHDLLPATARMDGRSASEDTEPFKPVYDILNAGPRHRFVVLGDNGPFVVHNCVQALARIIVMSQLIRISRKLRVALTVHDSIIALARESERDEARAFVESCMRWVPPWAEGLPVNCESKWGYNYGELSED